MSEREECDGCRRGLPRRGNGNHWYRTATLANGVVELPCTASPALGADAPGRAETAKKCPILTLDSRTISDATRPYLSVNTMNALANSHRETVREVLAIPDEELYRIRNLGPVGRAQIERLRAALSGTAEAPTPRSMLEGVLHRVAMKRMTVGPAADSIEGIDFALAAEPRDSDWLIIRAVAILERAGHELEKDPPHEANALCDVYEAIAALRARLATGGTDGR